MPDRSIFLLFLDKMQFQTVLLKPEPIWKVGFDRRCSQIPHLPGEADRSGDGVKSIIKRSPGRRDKAVISVLLQHGTRG
jgi:hypothetical protein